MDQKELYERNWSNRLIRNPEMWPINTIIKKILKGNGRILEIGPGIWPKSPIASTFFLELTEVGAANLRKVGARASTGSIENIPFQDCSFDIVVALEVIEHVPNVQKSFSDVKRVLKRGGYFIFSTPVHQKLWTHFDTLAGHLRRFNPTMLLKYTLSNDLRLIKFTGRKDAPLFISNLNALMEIRFRSIFTFFSEMGLNLLSSVHGSKIYRELNKQAYDHKLWLEPNLFLNMSKKFGNVTLICRKKLN
ncbi:MAG: class I SAM-dependent methyltransferase [Candidatus Heimdallarchaeota archaeon]|nr:MAG: class I SAM-dependent methyltransferase [Candidatus Heimdallarchaeota archaeon]